MMTTIMFSRERENENEKISKLKKKNIIFNETDKELEDYIASVEKNVLDLSEKKGLDLSDAGKEFEVRVHERESSPLVDPIEYFKCRGMKLDKLYFYVVPYFVGATHYIKLCCCPHVLS